MAEVYVKSAKAYIKFLDPTNKTYNEEIGQLNSLEDEIGVPVISDIGLSTIRDDINAGMNAVSALTQSSVVNKIVDYSMEVTN